MIKEEIYSSQHNRDSSFSDVGWRFPSLIAKVIVDYD